MRSATLIEPCRFRIDSLDTPEPGMGEVRIRVRGCGVCGSDMGPWKGIPGLSYPLQPGAPGHEVFGTVESVGPGDCVIRLAAFGTGGGAELRNVDGSFYDFELARFSGRSEEITVRESRDWLGKAILDWAARLGKGERFDPAIERSVRVSEVVDAVYRRD